MTVAALEKRLKPYQDPVKESLLKWLYTHLPARPITSKKMHEQYLRAVEILIKEREEDNCPEALELTIERYLDSVMPFIENYEKKEFALGTTSPEEMLRFLMEQSNLSQYDIASEVGGQPVVSEILRGKRKLSRDHIERLSKRFGVRTATFFSS